jgi:hypothetical protein
VRKGRPLARKQAGKGGITAYAKAASTRLDIRQQQLGGFVHVVTRAVETNGASSPPLILDDLESVSIHECVAACNIRVLELQEAHLETGLCLSV